jgi:hypothetical protein
MTLLPLISGIVALQLVVPDAEPLPALSLDHVTCVTVRLSEAVPPRLNVALVVEKVERLVGDEMAIVGWVVSAVLVAAVMVQVND